MMRFEGAFSREGFSTIWVTQNSLPLRSPMPTTPYIWMRSAGIDHLGETTARMLHQHVRQEQRERLVADQFARAPDRVTEPERLLLAREARGARRRQVAREHIEIGVPLAVAQRHLQLELAVEMVLD